MAAIDNLPAQDLERYYRAAFLGLRALDPQGERFSPAADAHWRNFRGDLREGDRIDLLLRDLAADHPVAFAPRDLFLLPGLPADEPFGPDWPGPPARLADELLRQPPPSDLLSQVAALWGLAPAAPDLALVARVQPASRILAAGAGAVLALHARFADRRDLDLADQVVLVADTPGPRQLFGLCRALLGSAHPARVIAPGAPLPTGFHPDFAIASPDASDRERAALAPGAR